MYNDYDGRRERERCDYPRQRADYLLPRIVWRQEVRAHETAVALSGIVLPDGCCCPAALRAIETRCAYARAEISEGCGGLEVCFTAPVCLRVCSCDGRQYAINAYASACIKLCAGRIPLPQCAEYAIVPCFRIYKQVEIENGETEVCASVCAELFAIKCEATACGCNPPRPRCPELPLYPQLPMPDCCDRIPKRPVICPPPAVRRCSDSCDGCERPQPKKQCYTGCLREFFR
ncbi:MAG: hypothetical protein PHI27_07840 [Eubacteriales bacterium]|nr:hypothetical protein [Eubacteriales bacterium]MDD3882148.1 hypothetical protein [Eubacteriales bacterium]MDD4513253.1 hypothetical protein [Eubacteriales bacterium]